MQLTCACGITGSLELFTSDEDARRFGALVDKLPAAVRSTAPHYLGLFRPAKRRLVWDRACRLTEELRALIEAGAVARRGRSYPASPALFASAMQQMLDTRERLELPLANHSYLIAIVAGDSPREQSAAESAAEALKRTASQARAGSRSRAVAELSIEIGRRKSFGEPAMTAAEREAFLARETEDEE